jgi:hypothetical protein
MLQEDGEIALASATDKGKGKEREEFDLAQVHTSFPEQLESPMYPPNSEDAEETRRVEEVASDRLSRICLIFCRLEPQKVGSSRASAKKSSTRIEISFCFVPRFRRVAARQPVIFRSQWQATFYQQTREPCCSAIARQH